MGASVGDWEAPATDQLFAAARANFVVAAQFVYFTIGGVAVDA